MTLTRFEFTHRVRPILEVGIGSTVFDESAALWDVALWDAPTSKWNGDDPLWRDVACDIIDAHIEIGRERITDPFPVGTATVTVDNTSGWADPSVDVDTEPGWIEFDGGLGELTIPDSAALDLTGDFTMLIRLWLNEAPATSVEMVRKWDSLPGYGIQVFSDADVNITISDDGATTEDYTTTLMPPAVGMWRWFAFAFDANDGAGGHIGTWWYGGNDTSPFAWQLIESFPNPGVFSMNPTTSLLRLGGQTFDGRIGHFELRTGHGGLTGGDVAVGGTAIFTLDGWTLDASDVDAATLTATTGQTITVVTTDGSTPTVVPTVNPAGASPLKMRPGRPIRIGVQHDTFGTRWLYNGFVDEILPVDTPEEWSTVTFECIDALGEAGRAKLNTNIETGANEQARTRFTRVLNAISWPAAKRSVSTSAVRPLYAAELDGQVVDLLRQTAESEGGWAFGDDQGRVVLKHHDWLLHVASAPVDATIGNNAGVADSELLLESGDMLLLEQGDELLLESETADVCTSGWRRSFSRRDITTRVILDRDYPTDVDPLPAVTASDPPAITLYGIEPYERLDLWTRDTDDLQQIAGRILATRAAALSMPRISAVTVDASTSDATVDLLSQVSIFTPSRYRCRFTTSRGLVFDSNFFAVGVTHDIAADGWTAEIALDRSFPFGVLDPADYVWDTARWDRSLWN